jgi:hypothetical protein
MITADKSSDSFLFNSKKCNKKSLKKFEFVTQDPSGIQARHECFGDENQPTASTLFTCLTNKRDPESK